MKFLHLGLVIALASSLVAMNNDPFRDGVPAFLFKSLHKPLGDESIKPEKPSSSLVPVNNDYFEDAAPAFSNFALVPYKTTSIQDILDNFKKALNETTEFKLNIPKFSLNISEVKLNLPELQIIEPNSYGLMREHTLYSQALYKNSIGFEVIGNSGTYRFIANKETPKDELMKVFNEWLKSLHNIEPSNLKFIDSK